MTAVVVAGWLSCSFDYLEGIARRKEHPTFQEVEIVALFQSRGGVEVVRRELEAEIVDVGHDTLEAWPKWCVSSVVSWWGGGRWATVDVQRLTHKWPTFNPWVFGEQEPAWQHVEGHRQHPPRASVLPQGPVHQTHGP